MVHSPRSPELPINPPCLTILFQDFNPNSFAHSPSTTQYSSLSPICPWFWLCLLLVKRVGLAMKAAPHLGQLYHFSPVAQNISNLNPIPATLSSQGSTFLDFTPTEVLSRRDKPEEGGTTCPALTRITQPYSHQFKNLNFNSMQDDLLFLEGLNCPDLDPKTPYSVQYDHEGLNCPDPDSKTLYSEQNDFLSLEGLNCPDPDPKTP